jgi:hypothetical protein
VEQADLPQVEEKKRQELSHREGFAMGQGMGDVRLYVA